MNNPLKPADYIFKHGRSAEARQAEDCDKFPITRAIPMVAKTAKCTRQRARDALVATWEGECYQTGMYGRKTDYYSVIAAIAYIRASEAESPFESDTGESS